MPTALENGEVLSIRSCCSVQPKARCQISDMLFVIVLASIWWSYCKAILSWYELDQVVTMVSKVF